MSNIADTLFVAAAADMGQQINKHIQAANTLLTASQPLSSKDVQTLNTLRDSLVKLRDDAIYMYHNAGVKQARLASSFNLSPARINQIIKVNDSP